MCMFPVRSHVRPDLAPYVPGITGSTVYVIVPASQFCARLVCCSYSTGRAPLMRNYYG